MNKFVFTALATTMVGATALADSEWPELDRELAALNNAPLTQDAGGPYVSGWLIAAFSSDDTPDDLVNDELGTGVRGSRINVAGTVGDSYEFKLGFDFTDAGELYAPGGVATATSGTAGITDAYTRFEVGGEVGIKIGIFRRQFVRSAIIDRNKTLFINRSYLGGMNSSRDAGLALDGSFSRLNWEIAVMNGHSGTQDDFAFSGHVDVDILGSSRDSEGAHGASEGANLNIGVTFASDGADTNALDVTNGAAATGLSRDDDQLAVDAYFSTGAFSLWGEMVDQDVDTVAYQGPGGQGATPYSVGVSFAFGENYEAAFRWDDWDTADNIVRYNFVVNRYIQGHDIKWQLEISSGSDDDTTNGDNANDRFGIGLALGF